MKATATQSETGQVQTIQKALQTLDSTSCDLLRIFVQVETLGMSGDDIKTANQHLRKAHAILQKIIQ